MFAAFKLTEFPEIAILLFTAYLVYFNLLLPSILMTVCHLFSFPIYPIIFPIFLTQPFSFFNLLPFRDTVYIFREGPMVD